MERLTTEFEGFFVPKEFIEVDEYDIVQECKDCWEICGKANNDCKTCAIQHCFNKLAAYEDAEEAGLLFKFPCKVGDYVYQIDRMHNKINTKQIAQVSLIQGKKSQSIQFDFETSGHCLHTDFGRTVFINKVDAMNALNAKTEVKE